MFSLFPDPTLKRKGSRDVGNDSWFCKLSNRDYLHRFVLEHMRSRDGAHDQENTSMSPDPFPLEGGVWERDYIVLCAMTSARDLSSWSNYANMVRRAHGAISFSAVHILVIIPVMQARLGVHLNL